jgi:hypothetical protein
VESHVQVSYFSGLCEQNDVTLLHDVQPDLWTASGPAELIPERWTLLRKKRALRYSKKENILKVFLHSSTGSHEVRIVFKFYFHFNVLQQ